MSALPLLGRQVVPVPQLPERVVQFGTGALLRALIDTVIDDANRVGAFAGRVVAIGSTASGREDAINRQDGLFTLRVEGKAGGVGVHESRVIASVSRSLSAASEWDAVLECARNPLLDVVFSNTTEVGIALHPDDDPAVSVPKSFPARLTRFLEERARAFGFAPDKGVIVIPCELIERNGDTLRGFVRTLADRWQLRPAFSRWVDESVVFCNTLVDRIVPGAPPDESRARIEEELGYRDELITVCEPYRLLAIQGDATVRARLGFARPESGVIVAEDITPYRERKVRILNGAHTALACFAILAGCETVLDAVEHERVGPYLRRLLFDEIVPTVAADGAEDFARQVLERFSNPSIRHQLRDITLHAGAKMRVRVVPAIVGNVTRSGRPPALLTLGFASYLHYIRTGDAPGSGVKKPDQVGERIRDVGNALRSAGDASPAGFARAIGRDTSLWGLDLDSLPGFTNLLTRQLVALQDDGPLAALAAVEPPFDYSATGREPRERILT